MVEQGHPQRSLIYQPKLDGEIVAGGGDQFPIRAEVDIINSTRVAFQIEDSFTAFHIQYPGCSILNRNSQIPSIRAEIYGVDVISKFYELDQFTAIQPPD